jgi:hypothetical protein
MTFNQMFFFFCGADVFIRVLRYALLLMIPPINDSLDDNDNAGIERDCDNDCEYEYGSDSSD